MYLSFCKKKRVPPFSNSGCGSDQHTRIRSCNPAPPTARKSQNSQNNRLNRPITNRPNLKKSKCNSYICYIRDANNYWCRLTPYKHQARNLQILKLVYLLQRGILRKLNLVQFIECASGLKIHNNCIFSLKYIY